MKSKWLAVVVILCIVQFGACSGRDDTTELAISQNVILGVESGILTAFDFSSGKKGKVLASSEFVNGQVALQIKGFEGDLYLELTQATYRDPILKDDIKFEDQDVWVAIIPEFDGTLGIVNINPITTVAAFYALHLIENEGIASTSAIIRANQEIGDHFGVTDILRVVPLNFDKPINFSSDSAVYGLVIAGLAKVAVDKGGETGENLLTLTRAFVRDIQDGTLDSAHKGETIIFGGSFLQHAFIGSELSVAMASFLGDTSLNKSGLTTGNFTDILTSLEAPNSGFYIDVTNVSNDNVPPAIVVQGFASGVFFSGQVEITVNAIDNLSGVQSLTGVFDNVPLVDEDPDPAVLVARVDSLQFLDDSYVLELTGLDKVGNQKKENVIVIVDNTFPTIDIKVDNQQLVDGDSWGGAFDLRVEIDGEPFLNILDVTTDDPGINGSLQDTNPNVARFESVVDTLTFLQTTDTLEIFVTAEDSAGNVSQASLLLNINNTGPVYTFIDPTNNEFIEGTINVAIAVDNEFGIAIGSVTLQRNGTVLQTLIDDTPGDGFTLFTDSFDSNAFTSTWGDGDVDLVIDTTDLVGIQNEQSILFNVNNILQTEWLSMRNTIAGGSGLTDEGLGEYVAVGDFNDDGYDDYVGIGRWYDTVQGWPIGEEFRTYWGPDFDTMSGDLTQVGGLSPYSAWNTYRTPTFFGPDIMYDPHPLDSCDMDGDGKTDLIVARENERFTINFGPQTIPGNFDQVKVIDSPEAMTGEGFGLRVYCADLDSDGYDDVLADTGWVNLPTSYKRMWIIYGDSNRSNIKKQNSKKLQYLLSGSPTYKYFNLKPIGDLDGDGKEDMIANHDWKNFRIFYGPFGTSYSPNGSNTSPVKILGSAGIFDLKRFSRLADFDGDGKWNFAVIHWSEDVTISSQTYNNLGKVWVPEGSSNRTTAYTSANSYIIPESGQYSTFNLNFGKGGVTAGDYNGDGAWDFMIGVPGYKDGSLSSQGAIVWYKGPNHTSGSNQDVLNITDWLSGESNGNCGYVVGSGDTNNNQREDMIFGCRYHQDGTFIVARDAE